jgi:hypothetical protein
LAFIEDYKLSYFIGSGKAMSIDYSTCKFEARLQKYHFLRKNESFYLYVSAEKIIINT